MKKPERGENPWTSIWTGTGYRIDDASGKPVVFIYGTDKLAREINKNVILLGLAIADPVGVRK